MSDSKVYLYFVTKHWQARRRIPWNSCACSIFHVFYILGIISEFLNSQPSCCQLVSWLFLLGFLFDIYLKSRASRFRNVSKNKIKVALRQV